MAGEREGQATGAAAELERTFAWKFDPVVGDELEDEIDGVSPAGVELVGFPPPIRAVRIREHGVIGVALRQSFPVRAQFGQTSLGVETRHA